MTDSISKYNIDQDLEFVNHHCLEVSPETRAPLLRLTCLSMISAATLTVLDKLNPTVDDFLMEWNPLANKLEELITENEKFNALCQNDSAQILEIYNYVIDRFTSHSILQYGKDHSKKTSRIFFLETANAVLADCVSEVKVIRQELKNTALFKKYNVETMLIFGDVCWIFGQDIIVDKAGSELKISCESTTFTAGIDRHSKIQLAPAEANIAIKNYHVSSLTMLSTIVLQSAIFNIFFDKNAS